LKAKAIAETGEHCERTHKVGKTTDSGPVSEKKKPSYDAGGDAHDAECGKRPSTLGERREKKKKKTK